MKLGVWMFALTMALFASSCQRKTSGTVIARVGDSELTLEEARKDIDTANGMFEHNLREYVSHWVDMELLHKEAQRRGIEQSEKFTHQLREIRKQLANNNLLEEQIYADSSEPVERTLLEYYQNHASEFFVREDMVKLNLIIFSKRDQASLFAAAVSRGTPWKIAVENVMQDTSMVVDVLTSAIEQYYTQPLIYPPELWKIVNTVPTNEISFPVRTTSGYAVVQPLAFIGKGKQAEYEFARDEVRERVRVEKRRKSYNELLTDLRRRYTVEILSNLGNRPDTTQEHLHE